ncbi:MAG TPA: hypothetical protein VFS47_08585 [Steroidobacteraceae bacterium]|nr:hypothetical protein [Steroidobacteraceae bacterium]
MISNRILAGPSLDAVSSKRSAIASSIRQARREKAWAWLTLVTLILCWDASIRLDERISPPRARIAHMGEAAEVDIATLEPGSRRR